MAADLSGSIPARDPLPRILIGFLALWFVLDRSAAMLGSFSGEAGLFVCVAVLFTAVIVERILFGIGPPACLHALGFRRPERDAVRATFLLCAALLAFYPLFSLGTTLPLRLADGWPILLIGLFLQGGIAEEVVFRGYLFRHLRRGRSFWRAASLAALPSSPSICCCSRHSIFRWRSQRLSCRSRCPSRWHGCSTARAAPSGCRRSCTSWCRARSSW